MTRPEFKTLKINPDLHKKLKDYCNENGLKLNTWIEKQLEKIIIEREQKIK
jgi:predicted HicB family RNase H-like nuclease